MSGRYGKLIEEARKEEGETSKPSNQKDGEPAKGQTSKPVKQKTIKPEKQQTIEYVNLTIKVPKGHRQHWVAEAKREGTSMVAIIQEALEKRYGLP